MGNISRLYEAEIAPGELNDATLVSAEFNNIIDNGVNDNDTRLSSIEPTVSSNSSRITTNEADIDTNATNIASNTVRIITLESGTTYGYEAISAASYELVSGGSHGLVFTNAGNVVVTTDVPSNYSEGEVFWLYAGSTLDRQVDIRSDDFIGTTGDTTLAMRPFESCRMILIEVEAGVFKWQYTIFNKHEKDSTWKNSLYVHNQNYVMGFDENAQVVKSIEIEVDLTFFDGSLVLPSAAGRRGGDSFFITITNTQATSSYVVKEETGGSADEVVRLDGVGSVQCIVTWSIQRQSWLVFSKVVT